MSWDTILSAMLPEHCLLIGIVVLISLDMLSERPRGLMAVSLIAVAAATAAAVSLNLDGYTATPFPGQFVVDPALSLAKAVVLALALPVLLASQEDFRSDGRYFALVLSSLYGFCLLLSSGSFLTLFLGLELMSLPVYVLVLLAFQRAESVEAALKYLVLGGAASATLLLGVSLLFGSTGSLAIDTFATAVSSPDTQTTAAVLLILAALFLKAAIVPFHAWAPDAYEGASIPVTAYMATIIKAAVLLAALRLFATAPVGRPLLDVLAILPLVSIVWGNLVAMRQDSFRRMIAYSSIAHAGYLFYAFLGAGPGRFESVVFYVAAYGLMNILAFASLPVAAEDGRRDRLDNLKGLFQRQPFAAVMIATAMLSLAGLPPLPGFVAKFLIFRNVIAAGYTTYAVLGLVGSYLGIYFYLRVIQYMFMSAGQAAAGERPSRAPAVAATLLCLVPGVVLTVFPGWVLGLL